METQNPNHESNAVAISDSSPSFFNLLGGAARASESVPDSIVLPKGTTVFVNGHPHCLPHDTRLSGNPDKLLDAMGLKESLTPDIWAATAYVTKVEVAQGQ